MQRLEAYLVLGCNGRITPRGFLLCRGAETPVIDLSLVDEELYEELLTFLDEGCDLFSAPTNDYNKCVNTLSYLYRKHNAYDQDTLLSVQTFLQMHKSCGVWLSLILKEDFNHEPGQT